jgi:SPP1 gp7 family putative phage head morphogenesis protein
VSALREKVEKSFIAGQRAESLEDFIKDRFSVSENKSRFLARQEMSLASSKFRENRYKQAGVQYYKWSTSKDERVRDSHAELDGRIFNFDDPPIVDKATGSRANPGEWFNCRCVAIPVINEVEE